MGASPQLPASLRERLATVRSCGVITGAGVSRESGLPTFRGEGGLLADPGPGRHLVEALGAATLATDPDRTWEAVAELCARSLAGAPGPAHAALVALERRLSRFVLATQNPDGLHQRAGNRAVVELHGNYASARCTECGEAAHLTTAAVAALARAPRCPGCSGVLRPDIVLFGELLPLDRVETLLEEFYLHPPDLTIVAGTSVSFTYIAEPVLFAQQAGRLTIEINPEVTPLSEQVSIALRGPAGLYLPAIANALGAEVEQTPDEPRVAGGEAALGPS